MKNKLLSIGAIMLLAAPTFISCSSEEDIGFTENSNVNELCLNKEKTKPVPTRMSVSDFISLVKDDCSKEELDFLLSLSPTDTMYVYKRSEQNYPTINASNLKRYKSLLKTGLSLQRVESAKPIMVSTVSSRSDIQQRKTFKYEIKSNYNAIIEGTVSLMGYFSYMYDVLDDEAVPGYPATVSGAVETNVGDPSLVLEYVPQSDICDVMPDRISLSYSMVGRIVLGAAFGDYAAGAPIEQISESGVMLIPPGGGDDA